MEKVNIIVIGAGRMAEAIVAGLLQHKREDVGRIVITNRSRRERLQELKNRYRVEVAHTWQEEIGEADVVLLAIPPTEHHEVLDALAPYITKQLVITIAGGIGLTPLTERLPSGTAVAWIMPNTAAQIGESISPFTMNNVDQLQRSWVELLVGGIGSGVECTEQEVINLTAITGSAPAFIYRIAEVLGGLTEERGIEPETGRRLVAQMIYGTSKMLMQEGEPAQLREQVTSPGGSTAAGLQSLEDHGFEKIFCEAIRATDRRAYELTNANGEST
ncbi:pyrroline-5-carboxylate reductase [Mechercharimyces sp. CAU 1602]|uniref:pyrroline-5-carboxylate reductase n=1 Tax=Mechercharimyces sp. CAU 1602 TaxID=2973933 RepID=UPI0021626F7E|nr:pyrroline-5-carboxylate reductase [Mechercharimyces sp. CAU 1602]MCS1352734.1 pyrroline-5-carboxylate reductase [Mechercharimyces sp. CAU 1602]